MRLLHQNSIIDYTKTAYLSQPFLSRFPISPSSNSRSHGILRRPATVSAPFVFSYRFIFQISSFLFSVLPVANGPVREDGALSLLYQIQVVRLNTADPFCADAESFLLSACVRSEDLYRSSFGFASAAALKNDRPLRFLSQDT